MEYDARAAGSAVEPPVGVEREAFTLAYLAVHEAQCPACGYNVHRLTQARCPECGRPLAVQVVAAIAGFSKPWLVMMLAWGIAAGFGLLIAAVTLHERLPSWRQEPDLLLLLFFFMGNLPLPVLHLLWRRRFVRQSRRVQWWIALPVAGVTALMVICFLVRIWH